MVDLVSLVGGAVAALAAGTATTGAATTGGAFGAGTGDETGRGEGVVSGCLSFNHVSKHTSSSNSSASPKGYDSSKATSLRYSFSKQCFCTPLTLMLI